MTLFFRIHSGATVRNGVAVLFVGPSGAGKSTLVLRLVTNGFSFLSDDEVWLDPVSLLLHPSDRPLLLKESAWNFFPEYRQKFVQSEEKECRSWWLDSEDIRPGCRAAPSPIWGLIFLRPPCGNHPSMQEIGQTEALGAVLPECMNFPEFGAAGLSVLIKIVKTAKLFRLNNGDLDECAAMLSEVLP